MIMYGYIYLTTNTVNGKKYIGQHQGMRFDGSYLGSGKALKRAIQKYGRDSFVVEVVEFCSSQEELNQREFDLIEGLKAVESTEFYNLIPGGNAPPMGNRGNRDFRHTDETKQRQSQSHYEARARKESQGRDYVSPEAQEARRLKLEEFWTAERRQQRAEDTRARVYGSTDDRWVDLEDMLATMSQNEIADFLNVDQSAVAQRIRSRGIVVEKTDSYHEKIQRKREQSAKMAQEARRKQGDKTWAGYDLREMYKTMTQKQIADIVGVSQVRVSQRLRQLGITKSG